MACNRLKTPVFITILIVVMVFTLSVWGTPSFADYPSEYLGCIDNLNVPYRAEQTGLKVSQLYEVKVTSHCA